MQKQIQTEIPPTSLQVTTKLNWRTTLATGMGTKMYADACWQAAPTLSPDAWRLWEGFTIGKVWLTLHGHTTLDALELAYTSGLNAWVLTPSSTQIVEAYFRENPSHRSQILLLGLYSWDANFEAPYTLDIHLPVLPDTSIKAEDLTPLLETLETHVREGACHAYGLAGEAFANTPLLEEVFPLAQAAAQKVWTRRKRPHWRLTALPLNMLELGALHTPHPTVAPLTFASQRHIGVLALRATLAQTPAGMVSFQHNHPILIQLAQMLFTRIPPSLHTLTLPQLALQLTAAIPAVVGVLTEPEVSITPKNIKACASLFHIPQPSDIAEIIGHFKKPVDNS